MKNIMEYFEADAHFGVPYVIAEAGVNHEGKMDIARRLIDEAREAGADAIKFQSYKAETLASVHSPAYWDLSKEPTTSQYELFKRHDSFWKNEFDQLASHCARAGIEFMSTPFDIESADFLNDMCRVFKISSSDITNKPFIEHIAAYGKPIILSTGASYESEVREAVGWIERFNVPLALLHCVLNYPTNNSDANLGMIKGLKKAFPDRVVGYSDHTLPDGDMRVVTSAVLIGAEIVEKHFTHDKSLPGNDHYHAMDKSDLANLCRRIEAIRVLIGGIDKAALASEAPAINNARRSLVAVRDIRKGESLSFEDLTWKRPAHGISPKHIEEIVGRTATVDIEKDAILKWEFFQ